MSPINSEVYSGSVTFSEGNLGINTGIAANKTASTLAMPSGKWYAEVRVEDGPSNAMVGVCRPQDIVNSSASAGYGGTGHVVYTNLGRTYNSSTSYSTDGLGGGDAGDIWQLAIDVDNLKIWYGRNGTWEGTVDSSGGHTLDSGTQVFVYSYRDLVRWNFGQNGTFDGNETAGGNSDGTYGDFQYSVPSGYKALCSANLSATIDDPSAYFQIKTYDDGSGAKTFDGNSDLQPDLVWMKSRGSDYDHKLVDSVRGVTKSLETNSTDAEATESTGLTAFGTDGFTVGGYSGYSVDFDGTNDYCALGFSTPADSTFTWSAWIKTTDTTAVIVAEMAGGLNVHSRGGIIIYGGNWYFTMGNGSSSSEDYSTHSASAVTDGEWHHVAQVVDGTSMKMYVDGSLDASFTSSVSAGTAGAQDITIGALGGASYWLADAKIDEVAFFTSALSSSDLTAIYNSGKPASLSSYSPYGWWRMGDNDNGSGTTITDQGSGGNDGTLTNGPTYSTDTPSDPNADYTDITGDGMVAWGWKEGATQGFDIVIYNGNDDSYVSGGAQSISHGLGVKPDMLLIKSRTNYASTDESIGDDGWVCWHSSLTDDDYFLKLNSNSGEAQWQGGSGYEPIQSIGPSNFSVSNENSMDYVALNYDDSTAMNGLENTDNYVAYCFSSVAGFSKAFKFTTANAYVHLGFRPAWMILKRTDSTGNWLIIDDQREGYNVDNDPLYGDSTAVEGTTDLVDITSNGFKVRSTDSNISGDVIGYAMASAPAKYSLAR